jgi:hypothetical protein
MINYSSSYSSVFILNNLQTIPMMIEDPKITRKIKNGLYIEAPKAYVGLNR